MGGIGVPGGLSEQQREFRTMQLQIRKLLTWQAEVGDGSRIRATSIGGIVPPSSLPTGSGDETFNNDDVDMVLGDVVEHVGGRFMARLQGSSILNLLRVLGVITDTAVAAGDNGHVRQIGYCARINTTGTVQPGHFLRPVYPGPTVEDVGLTPLPGCIALSAGASAAVADYDTEVLADTPVGYWKLDETVGTTAADSSGNGLDGTIINAPTLGGADDGITLNGVDQEIQVPDDALLDVFAGDFTMEIWFLRGSIGTDQSLMAKGANSGQIQLRVFSGVANAPYLVQDNTALAAHGAAITDTVDWHHAMITVTGATYAIYVDGVDVTVQDGTVTFSDTGNPLHIGSDVDGNGAQFFDGSVKRVALYASALSAGRAAVHYSAAAGASLTGFVPAILFPVLRGTEPEIDSVADPVNGGTITSKILPADESALVGLYMVPGWLTLGALDFYIEVAGSGGGGTTDLRFCIYDEQGTVINSYFYPGLDTSAGPIEFELGTGTLSPGAHYVSVQTENSTLAVQPTIRTITQRLPEVNANGRFAGGIAGNTDFDPDSADLTTDADSCPAVRLGKVGPP